MDLMELYQKWDAQLKQTKQVILSGQDSGLLEMDLLCGTFGIKEIVLREGICAWEQEMLSLAGKFFVGESRLGQDGGDQGLEMKLAMKLDKNGRIDCEIRIPDVVLDEAGLFCIRNGLLHIILQEGTDAFLETLNGELPFGGHVFQVSARRQDQRKQRQLQIRSRGSLDVMALLASLLGMVGLDIEAFPFSHTSLTTDMPLTFFYTEPTGFLTASQPEKNRYDDALRLRIETGLGFLAGGSFGIENAAFSVGKCGSRYDFFIDGEMKLFHAGIPFQIRFGDGCVMFAAGLDQKIPLNSVNDMGAPVGESQVLDRFPETLRPSGAVCLHTLQLIVSSDFKTLYDFQITVELEDSWNFCPELNLSVSDLLLSFGISMGMKQFALAGDVTFCNVKSRLSAAILSESSGPASWSLKWRMYEEESVSLTALAKNLADAFGIATRITLPDISVGHVAVEFSNRGFSVGALITLSDKKLFSSEMDLRFVCEGSGADRRFAGTFQWKSQNAGLTVEHVLTECGVTDGLEAVPDFIKKLGISQVTLGYEFAENKMTAVIRTAEADAFAIVLYFEGTEQKQCQYILAAEFHHQISLADLPAAGGVSPSLKEIRIEAFSLTAASCSRENVTIPDMMQGRSVKKGITLSCQMSVKKQNIPLELHVLGDSPEEAQKQLPAAERTEQKGEKEIPLHLRLGPLELVSIRLGYRDGSVTFGITAQIQNDALCFSLEGLTAAVSLGDGKISFGLDGISVRLTTDTVDVRGGFLNLGDENYRGTLLLQAGQLCLTAVGAYREKPFRSFLVFASMKGNLGGPPCFSVKGLAAGFGWQHSLSIPEVTNLQQFPLLQAAAGTLDTEELLSHTDSYFPIQEGQLWIAAGVLVQTFQMADSAAVLSVSLGRETEVTLTGQTLLNVPFDEEKAPIAHGLLLLKASFRPSEGLISVEGALSQESYVICRECHITGGFAFDTWYGGPHAGDFVLTMGGYHPSYEKPAHYPEVKRLGLCWRISDQLSAEGDVYFALTPSALMAGGGMKFLFSTSSVDAWLEARIHMLLQWKPYAYDFDVGVCAGVRVHLGWIRFGLELGCDLHIWGPEFSGKARMKLWCISFTVAFGAGSPTGASSIGTEEFRKSFLESEKGEQAGGFRLAIARGILKEQKTKQGEPEWTVAPEQLQLALQTAVPVKSLLFDPGDSAREPHPVYHATEDFYVRPCKKYLSQSELTVRISAVKENGEADGERRKSAEERFVAEAQYEQLPAALWGLPDERGETVTCCAGIRISVKKEEPAKLQFRRAPVVMQEERLLLSPPQLELKQYDDRPVFDYIARAADGDLSEKRRQLFDGLGEAYEKIQVADWANRAKELFCQEPKAVDTGGMAQWM